MFNKEVLRDVGSMDLSSINYFFSEDPLIKTAFLSSISEYVSEDIYYLDFDQLYSGYRKAGYITNSLRLNLILVKKENLHSVFLDLFKKVSTHKCIVIIDSLDGFQGILNKMDNQRNVNSFLVLFCSLFGNTTNKIFVGGSKKPKEIEFFLSRNFFYLKKVENFSVKRDRSVLSVKKFRNIDRLVNEF